MKFAFYKIIIVFAIILFSTSAYSDPAGADISYPQKTNQLDSTFIGLSLSQESTHEEVYQSDFYPALLDNNEQPYLDLISFFKNTMQYRVSCSNALQSCTVISLPPGISVIIDSSNNTAKIENNGALMSYQFPDNTLVVKDKVLWLRYDQLQKILPFDVKWDVNSYQLSLETSLPLLTLLNEKRKANNAAALQNQELIQEKEAQRKAEEKNALTPTEPFNASLQYQLSDNQTVHSSQPTAPNSRQAQFYGVADLFKGTLQTSGTLIQPKTGPFNYSWNYTTSSQYFDSLQFGNVSAGNTAFMSGYSVENGVSFNKIAQANPSYDFDYTGHTLPGTEVDVWRDNTYLVTIINVGQSGQFSVSDNNAKPGDTYTLKYYFSDGTSQSQTIYFSPDNGLLLSQGQTDADISYGRFNLGNSFYGHIGQSLFRYGVEPGLTAGIGTYYFSLEPSNFSLQQQTASPQGNFLHYADIDWQAFSSLNVQLDKMLNASGYALHAISNYFNNQLIELKYRSLPSNNPILQIPTFDPYQAATRMFSLKDTYQINSNVRLINDLESNNITNAYTSTLNYNINQYLRPAFTIGTNQPSGQNTSLQLGLSNSAMINANNLVTASWSWNKGYGNTENAQYSYHGLGDKNYSFQVGLVRTTGQNMQSTFAANWNITNNWLVTATYASLGQVLFSIAYTDAVSVFSKISKPSDYDLGSISGIVLSPQIPGQKQHPVEGAKVMVGGLSAVTNKNGAFVISGIPVSGIQYLTIDPDSLDASMAMMQDEIPLRFRPGTHIEYNPVLATTIGMDGYVYSDEILPKKLTVIAKGMGRAADVIRKSDVSPVDGYFELDKLVPGTYKLMLMGVADPPSPVEVVVAPDQTWVSNVKIKWHYTEPPPQPMPVAQPLEAQKPQAEQNAQKTQVNAPSQAQVEVQPSPQVEPVAIASAIFSNTGIFMSPVNEFNQVQAVNYCYMTPQTPIEVPKPIAQTAVAVKPQPSVNQQIDNIVQGVFAQGPSNSKITAHA